MTYIYTLLLLLLGTTKTSNASPDDSVTMYLLYIILLPACHPWLSGTTVQSAKHPDLGNEPWVLTPFPWRLSLTTLPLFYSVLPFHFGGGDHTLKGGASRAPTQSPTRCVPSRERDQSGTSFSATLRPGWALANPRLSKSRGSFPPTPGASWTGGFLL